MWQKAPGRPLTRTSPDTARGKAVCYPPEVSGNLLKNFILYHTHTL